MPRQFWSSLWIGALFALFVTVATATSVTAQRAPKPAPPSTERPYPSKPQPLTEMASIAIDGPPDDQPQPLSIQPAQQQAPDVPTDWWWLAFQSYRSNNWEIYRTRGALGSEFAQLTFHPAADTQPNLNPGVTAIVFVSARDGNPEIYRMGADGSDQIRLTNQPLTDTQPIWSPDSSQIVFVSQRDGNAELYRMNADGSAQQRLTTDGAFDLFPHWSPDGQQIVWVRAAGENGWLWLMNRDGSNPHAISGALRYLQHPVWSPDGSEIAFDYDPDRDGFNELGILAVADATIRLFQDWSLPAPSSGKELWMGEWSPNGAGITYTSFDYFWEPVASGYQLYWERAQIEGVCMTTHCDGTIIGVSQSSTTDLLPSVQSVDHLAPQTAVDSLPTYLRRTRLFVSWGGVDSGPSGIAGYDVEVRGDLESEWQRWHNRTSFQGDFLDRAFGVESAQTVHFRSRAVDNADNVEPWSANPNGDTTVTFYEATLAGRVTDARGIGRAGRTLPLLPAGLNQVQTSATGDYFVRLPTLGEYQLNGLRVNTSGDRVQPFYLDPVQNLMKNGDFESFTPLDGWRWGGTITPTLTISNVSSGLQGTHLGFDCANHCVTVDASAPLVAGHNYVPLWTPDGRFHLFYESFAESGTGKLYHSERTAPGVWSSPELLGDGTAYSLQAVGDRNGNLFVAWTFNAPDGPKIVLLTYTPENGWGPPVPFAGGEYPQLAIGDDGSLYLLYLQHCAPNCWESALVYRWRTAQGVWSSDSIISSEGYDGYRLLMGPDNSAHLFWYGSNKKYQSSNSPPRLLYYQTYRQGRPTQDSLILDAQEIFGMPDLDVQGNLVLFGNSQGGTLYTTMPFANAVAASVFAIDSTRYLADWSAQGTLHLFGQPNGATDPWHYRFQAVDKRWSTPQLLNLNGYFPKWLQVDESGQFEAITYNGEYIQFPPKVAAGRSTMVQTVTIPANLHEPTLSWMAEAQGSELGRSIFQVSVSAGLTDTVLYSTTAAAPWQLQWADLTPWIGQTITVTFAVSQADGDIPYRVFLDHVALGEWLTPVPQVVTPPQVEAGIGTTVVISGENFMATPQITVGGKLLTNVQLLSATTLEATIPNNLFPGIYDLVVTNPKGASTVLPGAVKVGKQLYLPIVRRP